MGELQVKLNHAKHHFDKLGLRWTAKREQVLSCLLESNRAISAYELADLCKASSGQSIPAMSVYRILDLLAENGLVHKLNLANKYVACAHIICSHSHGQPQFLICSKCSAVKEVTISDNTMNELQLAVDCSGFVLQSPQIEMNCLCSACAA